MILTGKDYNFTSEVLKTSILLLISLVAKSWYVYNTKIFLAAVPERKNRKDFVLPSKKVGLLVGLPSNRIFLKPGNRNFYHKNHF